MLVVALQLTLFLFSYTCHGLQISKNTNIDIKIKEGHPYDLSCQVDQAWDFCTWKNLKTGGKCKIVDGDSLEECVAFRDESDQPRVNSYNDNNDNTCTLRISQAVQDDDTTWECLIFSGISSVQATIEVTVYSPALVDFETKPNRKVTAGITASLHMHSPTVGKIFETSQKWPIFPTVLCT